MQVPLARLKAGHHGHGKITSFFTLREARAAVNIRLLQGLLATRYTLRRRASGKGATRITAHRARGLPRRRWLPEFAAG